MGRERGGEIDCAVNEWLRDQEYTNPNYGHELKMRKNIGGKPKDPQLTSYA